MATPWYLDPLSRKSPKPVARHRLVELRQLEFNVGDHRIGFNPFARLLPPRQIVNNTLVVPFAKRVLNLEVMKWQEAQANE